MGDVTGIPADVLITIHVKSVSGREAGAATMKGSGIWQAVVTDASGLDYIITADAEGLVSDPISYTIHLDGQTAYLVVDGHVTDQEAIDLDFDFKPK
jgi:hypothetical protein